MWHFHLFKNFPQFVVVHTVEGFSVANEAEIGVLLDFPNFTSLCVCVFSFFPFSLPGEE